MADINSDDIARILVFLRSGMADDVLKFLDGAKKSRTLAEPRAAEPEFLPSGLQRKAADNLGQFLGESITKTFQERAARFSRRAEGREGSSPFARYQFQHFESSLPLQMQGQIKSLRMEMQPLSNSFKDLADVSSGKLKPGFLGLAGTAFTTIAGMQKVVDKADAWAKGVLDRNFQYALSPSMAMVKAQAEMMEKLRNIEMGERTAGTASDLAQAQARFEQASIPQRAAMENAENWLATKYYNWRTDFKGMDNAFGDMTGVGPMLRGQDPLEANRKFWERVGSGSKVGSVGWFSTLGNQKTADALAYKMIRDEMDRVGTEAYSAAKESGVTDEAQLDEIKKLGMEFARLKAVAASGKDEDKAKLEEARQALDDAMKRYTQGQVEMGKGGEDPLAGRLYDIANQFKKEIEEDNRRNDPRNRRGEGNLFHPDPFPTGS